MQFDKLRPQALPALRTYMEKQPYRVCDNTVGAAFMWRGFLDTAYAVAADMLLFCMTLDGAPCFTFPIGDGDPVAVLAALEIYCRQQHIQMRLFGVPEPAVPLLERLYGARCRSRVYRNAADYLYTAETFLSFPGRHLAGQRNHVRRFWREHPDCRYLPLTAADIPAATAFIRRFCERRAAAQPLSAVEVEEGVRSRELLENMAALGMSGGMLVENGDILAVSLGEVMGDTLYVHVEKADTRCHGVYQAISQSFAQHMANAGMQYINREDDAGDAGLRRSKLSYRPCALLQKYAVEIEG